MSDEVWSEMTTPSIDLSPGAQRAREIGANQTILQYSPTGELLQRVDVEPLGLGVDGLFGNLLGPTAASSTTGTVLTASPNVIAVHDGEATLLDPSAFGLPDISWATIGVIGSVGSEVFVAVGNPGVAGFAAEPDIELVAVDPASGRTRPVSLPAGVRSPTGVCIHDDTVLAAAIGDFVGLEPGTVEVWQAVGRGSAPRRLGSAATSKPYAGSISLVCAGARVWVVEQNPLGSSASHTFTTVRTFEPESGAFGEPWTGPSSLQVIPGGSSVDADLVLSGAAGDPSSGAAWERRPRRWVDRSLGEAAQVIDDHWAHQSYLLSLGRRLFDVRPLLAHPPGGDAPPAVEVEVPQVTP